MGQVKLEVQIRKEKGSAESKELRRQGIVPGVVYGGEDAPQKIMLPRKELERFERQHAGESVLISLDLQDDGKSVGQANVLLHEIQYHPVNDTIDHVDFLRVTMGQKMHVAVPLALKGESIGLKREGANVEQSLRELDVICLPSNIPQHIVVDITNLDEHPIHVKDLILPEGVETKVDPEAVVVGITFSRTEEETPTEEEMIEPEVLKEKPKDGKPVEGDAKK